MGLLRASLRRPVTTMVILAGIVFFSVLSSRKIAVDIFPAIDVPTIYVSQPYGGMSPAQMEAFLSTRYEDHFLYVSGIKNIEVKNIQGTALLKLTFYEGTNMAQAAAEVTAQVTRSMAFMPPGTVPPTVIRFDASSLPVGQLVFSAEHRSLNELQEFAGRYVRPMFASIPGVSSPPPFGGNSRTIVVKADPEKLRSYGVTPDELVKAISESNQIAAAGNIRIGNTSYMTPSNTIVGEPSELLDVPIRKGSGPTIFIRDVASVKDAGDVTSGYALVNGKRAVYIPVLKRADASTWDVVQNIKKELPRMQAAIPEDVKVSYEFDQSVYVINAVKSLISEGAIGAILTGLMVLLFLGDRRSALIVILTIPLSIMGAVLLLFLTGQTINIMTLSGLALAVGVLVDQATVTIENIHQHIEMGKPKAVAIRDATREVAFPLLLILLCVLAVFAPSFLMSGVPRSMFLPLSLAVGFAMIISFLLSQSFVPVLSNWMLKTNKFDHEHNFALDKKENQDVEYEENQIEHEAPERLSRFARFRQRFIRLLSRLMERPRSVITGYFIITLIIIAACGLFIGKDILPHINSRQFQLRLRDPDGTRFEQTERDLLKVLDLIKQEVGPENVAISSAYVGTMPNTYPVSAIYQFMSGPQEALLQVNLSEDAKVNLDELKEKLRATIHNSLPAMKISFEPIELVDKVMSQGSPTPVEVMVAGKDIRQGKQYADSIVAKLKSIPFLRDVQIAQPMNYPVIDIDIDRERAGQLGLSVRDISRSVVAATSSSRYTEKIFWMDQKIGMGYQIQVQVPEPYMDNLSEVKNIPLVPGQARPSLGDVATLRPDTVPGEYDHDDSKRVITVTANIYNKDLGAAAKAVNDAVQSLGNLPRGMEVKTRGLTKLLNEILGSLQSGLLLAIVVIFLLLAANYQSFKVALVVLCTIPAVIAGALVALLITGSTLNLQSYMGIIMSIGISVANAILLATNAENLRRDNLDAKQAAITSASIRLRPILMTSLAMIAGMIPMASGLGEAGDQTAPLGRAVIGGLIASTLAALLVLPLVFERIQRKAVRTSVSLDPDDTESRFYDAKASTENS